MSEDLLETVQEAAKEQGESSSEYIRKVLVQHFDEKLSAPTKEKEAEVDSELVVKNRKLLYDMFGHLRKRNCGECTLDFGANGLSFLKGSVVVNTIGFDSLDFEEKIRKQIKRMQGGADE